MTGARQRRGVRSLLGLPRRLLAWVAVLLLAAGAVAATLLLLRPGAVQWESIERATLQFLRSEQVMFLVTDRVVTRVDVVSREGSMLLGWREGVLVGTVEFLCGVDLDELTAQDLRREEGRLMIAVPEPQVLQVVVDTGSLVFFEKKSGLMAVNDYLRSRDTRQELTERLEARAREFAAEKGLLPDRADIVKRLNELVSPLLEPHLGVVVRFR